jgi:hypothetical protein
MLFAQWLKDKEGKLYSKWVNTETNHSDLSDEELRSRIDDYTAELLKRMYENYEG